MTKDKALQEAMAMIKGIHDRAEEEQAHPQYLYGLQDAIEIINDYRAGLKLQECLA